MALAADIALLREAPLFGDMTDEELRLFAFGAKKHVFREGERLHERGRTAEGGLVVMMGRLALTDAEGDTREAEAGELLDEMALYKRSRHAETAVAAEDGAVMAISHELFMRMVEEYPNIAEIARARIADRLDGLLHAIEGPAMRLASVRD